MEVAGEDELSIPVRGVSQRHKKGGKVRGRRDSQGEDRKGESGNRRRFFMFRKADKAEREGSRGEDAVVERRKKRTTDSSIDRSRTKAVGKKSTGRQITLSDEPIKADNVYPGSH